MGEQCGALRRSNASNLPVAGCHFAHGRKGSSSFLLLQRFLNSNGHGDGSTAMGEQQLHGRERFQKYEPGTEQKPAERRVGRSLRCIYVKTEKSTSHTISRAGCASYILCGRDDVGIVPYIFGEEMLTSSALPQLPRLR